MTESTDNSVPNEMVRASAGTGKTTSLTRRYVKLLALGVAPETIVALTFTRKAAGEFFDRIAEMLAHAAADRSAADQLCIDIQLDPQFPKPDFAELLRSVIRRQHALMLGTLDSFFARVVRSFPFELGVAGGFRILDTFQLATERERALEGVFGQIAQRRAEGLRTFLAAFKQATFGIEEVQLNRLLTNYVNRHHRLLLSNETLEWGSETSIWGPDGSPWPVPDQAELEKWRQDFLLAIGNVSDQPRMDKWREAMEELVERPPGTALNASHFLSKNLLPNLEAVRQGDATITVNRKKVELDPILCQKLWKVVSGVLGRELRVRLQRAEGMQRLLRDFEKIYSSNVRSRGALTFDDLARLLGLIASQRHGGDRQQVSLDLGYRLDASYDHWLLDEFQDTSRAQWAALSDLIDEVVQDDSETRSLFVVGDTKQAIYGWREGDARLFGEVLERYNHGAEDRIKEGSLDESYRSAQPVIDAVNTAFGDRAAMESLFPEAACNRWHWKEHKAAIQDRVGYVELLESHPEGVTLNQGRLCLLRRFEVVAAKLRDIRPEQRGISCAILVQDNRTADSALDFLRDACPEIEFSTESSRRIVHENALTSALYSILQCAAHPADTLAWQHLRMTPMAEVIDRELRAPDAPNDQEATAKELSWRVLCQLEWRGFASTLQSWIDALDRHRPLDAFSRLRATQFVDIAGAFDRQGGNNITQFLAAIEDQEIRDSGGSRTVQIMTVHKAKGLDFDMVILCDLDGDALGSRDRDGTLVVGRGAEREVTWAIEAPAGKLAGLDPVLAAQKEAGMVDEVYEAFCKLYVAMTRPRHGLYIIVDKPSKSKSGGAANFARWLRETLGGAGASEPDNVMLGRVPCLRTYQRGEELWHQSIQPSPTQSAEPARLPYPIGQ